MLGDLHYFYLFIQTSNMNNIRLYLLAELLIYFYPDNIILPR